MKPYTLGEMCVITMGQAPRGDSYNDSRTGIPLIAGAGDFANALPSPKKYTTAPGKVSQVGDIILGIRASIGDRVWSDGEYCLGRGVAGLRAKSGLDSKYLWYWLGFNAQRLAAKGRGATFLQVNRKDIAEMELVLPALEEQRRIAAVLERADELMEQREAELKLLQHASAAIFDEMFSTLKPDRKLSEGCVLITDGTHQSPKWSPVGIPFIFITNIVDGEINLHTKRFISEDTWRQLTKRAPVEVGDVLYSTVGVTYGRPAQVRCEDRFAFQRHIAHIKPRQEVLDSEFLTQMLASPLVKRQADRVARGAAQPTVNLADIKDFDIIIPPIGLQREFGRRINHLRSIQRAVGVLVERHCELFAALQSRAFTGQL